MWLAADDLDSGCSHQLQSPPQTSIEEAVQTETEEDYLSAQ